MSVDTRREVLAEAGLECDALCGESNFMLFDIRAMVDEIERRVLKDPSDRILSPEGLKWLRRAKASVAPKK